MGVGGEISPYIPEKLKNMLFPKIFAHDCSKISEQTQLAKKLISLTTFVDSKMKQMANHNVLVEDFKFTKIVKRLSEHDVYFGSSIVGIIRAVAKALIGGCLFIYSCSARLVSFQIDKFEFDFKRN